MVEFAKCTKWHTSDLFLMSFFENRVFIGVFGVFFGAKKTEYFFSPGD